MNKSSVLNKISKSSPFFLIAFWSLILLANFLPSIPQPTVITGYLWKIEFALAGLILLTLLVALKFPKDKITFTKFSKPEIFWIILPLILFTIWSGFSLVWAESWRNALHHTLLWACYGVFYLLVRQIVSRPRVLDVCLKCAGLVVTVLGLACLIEYLSSVGKIDSSFMFRYYKYAEASATLLPIYLALALQSKSRAAFASGTVAVIAWLVILLSLSRTEFIAGFFCVGLFFALVFVFQDWKKYLKKSVLIISLLLLTVFVTQTSFLTSQENSTVNRFTGDGRSQTNLEWRFLVWGITLEAFKQKPFQGVGADNFSTSYLAARENYSNLDSQNKLLQIDESVLAERSHNEYLQILSELGIVGFFFFGWLLFGIVRLFLSIRQKQTSLLTVASLAGISAFLVSSIASSYSFRVPANGVCFFFVLALANSGLLRDKGKETARAGFNFLKLKPVLIVFSFAVCFAMLIFSAVRGVSLMHLQFALDSLTEIEAEQNFQKAIALDNQEPIFRYYYGLQLYNSKRSAEAVPQVRFAIGNGIATSISYFNLASAQILSQKTVEAEQTFVEALRIYPRSVFLRTAYASLLKQNGKDSQSDIEYEKALQINSKQAGSWQIAHREGMGALTRIEGWNKNFVTAMDLKPTEAIYALLDFQRQNNPDLVRR